MCKIRQKPCEGALPDKAGSLPDALDAVGHLATRSVNDADRRFPHGDAVCEEALHMEIRGEIDARRPVALQMLRRMNDESAAHFVVICGYDLSTLSYLVWNPESGRRWMTLQALHRVGDWERTIFVKKIGPATRRARSAAR